MQPGRALCLHALLVLQTTAAVRVARGGTHLSRRQFIPTLVQLTPFIASPAIAQTQKELLRERELEDEMIEKEEMMSERELLKEIGKIKKYEAMQERQMKATQKAGRSRLARATNRVSRDKLELKLDEEEDEITADKGAESALQEEFDAGLRQLRLQREKIENDKKALAAFS